MFGSLNSSVEGEKRRRLSLLCGFLIQTCIAAAAALIGMMIPVRHEVPVAHKQYQLTWTTAPKPLETPHNLKTPPKMARIVVPQVRPPETPKVLPPVVAQLEIP